MVYLVGAGPGDPGLMTVRGLDLLRRADVVLYDQLADSALLLETPPECELIDVGKRAGKHTKSQDETSSLLVEYGLSGRIVVRLKGGDPFLFGRGGEEAERLHHAGVPFAIVPGVSALAAVPAYAGIPLTHRDHASSLGVATGHGADGKDTDPIRWRNLAAGVDTVVVFMGVGNLGVIAAELAAGGITPDTPSALIERGCTPLQRVVTAPLEGIAAAAEREGVEPPALLVVGRSVSLAPKLAWYHPGPLAGLRIGVTRPQQQSAGFAERLRELGGRTVLMPTIETAPTGDTPEVVRALDNLDAYSDIIFSSVNGVEAFIKALRRRGDDARCLHGARIAAIGPATGDALGQFGIIPDLVAATFVAEGLLARVLESGPVAGRRFLLVRSDIGRDTIREGLVSAGATVDQAVFYTTRTATLRQHVLQLLRSGGLDVITFTSSSTVDGFFSQIDPKELPESLKLASIGPETSRAILRHGHTPAIEAAEYTTAGLAAALVAALGKEY